MQQKDAVDKLPSFAQGWLSYEGKEAVQTIPQKAKKIKDLIHYYQNIIDDNKEIEEEVRYSLVNKVPMINIELVVNLVMVMAPVHEEKDRLRQLERALLLRKKQKVPAGSITDVDIECAKATPIRSLITVRKDGKAKCLWHDDKNPSMHVYPDHVYCFSCARHGDAIDVTMAQQNISFIEAVKVLTKKV